MGIRNSRSYDKEFKNNAVSLRGFSDLIFYILRQGASSRALGLIALFLHTNIVIPQVNKNGASCLPSNCFLH